MILDLKTVYLGHFLSSALCAVVVASLWYTNRLRSPGTGLWLADYIMQFAAVSLLGLRGILPDFLSIVVANTLIVAGTVALYIGLERYLGKETRQLHNYVMLGLLAVALSYFTWIQPNVALRSTAGSLGLGLITAQAAWLMLRRVDAERRWEAFPAGLVFAAFAVIGVVRVATDPFGPQITGAFKLPPLDVAAILASSVLLVALTFSLFLLVSRTLLTEAEHELAERRLAEQALGKSEEKFRVAFETVPDAITISQVTDGTLIAVNESFSRATGYSADAALGHTALDIGLWEDPADRQRYWEALCEQGSVKQFSTIMRKASGEVFHAAVFGELVEVDGTKAALTVIHDETDRRLAEERLRELSDQDPLTCLLNQRAFYSAASARLAETSDARVSLLYMDLDGLKPINDQYGHPMGDDALLAFADVLRSAFRESDVVARLGGDEFAVLAVSRAATSDEVLLARFWAALAEKNARGDLPFAVDASVGVAVREPGGGEDLQKLIGVADALMYDAKRSKKAATQLGL
jgi:diguanylate cyclase (GGDEF)-like protein/PAS domain S-box-containing protein